MTGFGFDPKEIVRLRRDWAAHAWEVAIEGRWVALPWAETADAVSVAMWLEGRTGRALKIHVDQ